MSALALPAAGAGLIVHADACTLLAALPDGCAGLVYADPPFNSGSRRDGFRLRTERASDGDRRGFAGAQYRSTRTDIASFGDSFDDYLGWLRPLLVASRRVLAAHGTLYLHVDPRESHYCKVMLDEVFGRDCFVNEVIWAYDFGARTTTRWPAKHDVILVYARTAGAHHFDLSEVERIPYMAPGLQTPGARGTRQDADRRVVAHHRADQLSRAHRVSDAEAAGDPASHRCRVVATRRPGARLVRR